jgi:hypothetical protein
MHRDYALPIWALIVALISIAGCAAYRPVVDHRGLDRDLYESDLAECQGYAREIRPGAMAVGGAVVGALFGAAIGAVIGDHDAVEFGAGVGAVEGAAAGASEGAASQVDVIRMCMTDRGYRVLN